MKPQDGSKNYHPATLAAGLLRFSVPGQTGLQPQSTSARGRIDFNRDIRPIPSDKCLCHGPDALSKRPLLRLIPAAALAELPGTVSYRSLSS
jgi:hypothetical protein